MRGYIQNPVKKMGISPLRLQDSKSNTIYRKTPMYLTSALCKRYTEKPLLMISSTYVYL